MRRKLKFSELKYAFAILKHAVKSELAECNLNLKAKVMMLERELELNSKCFPEIIFSSRSIALNLNLHTVSLKINVCASDVGANRTFLDPSRTESFNDNCNSK